VTSPEELLDFWFGASGTSAHGTSRPEWFTRLAAFDEEIRRRFGSLNDVAVAGGLVEWEAAPRPALALVIVLDQFSRNLHRDSARAFAGDARALGLARRMVAQGWDRELAPLQRQFVYLPFEPAEDPDAQAESVRLARALTQFPETREALRWAEAHARIIARFGRFPHRNVVLGRSSTPEETEFLKEPGSRF
jgi:uncharacterized protein (DUF924 family)